MSESVDEKPMSLKEWKSFYFDMMGYDEEDIKKVRSYYGYVKIMKHYCDRCKKEIKNDDFVGSHDRTTNALLEGMGALYTPKLCKKCRKEANKRIIDFVKEKNPGYHEK